MIKYKFDKTKHTSWFISQDGRFFSSSKYNSDDRLRELKPNKNKRGYLYARTTNGNYQIHRLVAKYFLSNPKNKPCINHKDFNRHNNNADNLEWVTYSENFNYSLKNGRLKLFKKNESNNLKYSNKQCANVLKRVKSGMIYKVAGRKYNMPYSTVAHLVRGSRRDI